MKAALVLALALPAPSAAAPALNHVYVVLDQPTFDAIRASPVVARMLGRSDGGLPDYAPPAADADRIFLRGKRTYLELFAPTNRFGEPVGKVGIAVGEDRPADFAKLADRWRGWCGSRFRHDEVAWTRHAPPVPWYRSIQCDDTAGGNRLALWAMAYRPEFARWQRAPAIDRRAILAPRAARGQGRFDITAVTLDLPPVLHRRIVAQLARAGMVARHGRARVDLSGEGWTLSLRPVRGHARRTAITFAVNRAEAATVRLGSARWSSRTGHASLQF